MRTSSLRILATAAMVAISAMLLPVVHAPAAGATAGPGSARIWTLGTGTASAEPDVVRALLSVEAVEVTAQQAQTRNAETSEHVVRALTEAGVRQDDIWTSGLALQPEYRYDPQTGESAFVGYRATHDVTVLLRDIDGAGARLDDAVAAGGNAVRISRLDFELQDDTQLRSEARKAAFADARATADHYAGEAGMELGDVQSIDARYSGLVAEGANDSPAPAPGHTQLHPGNVRVVAEVEIVWWLRPGSGEMEL